MLHDVKRMFHKRPHGGFGLLEGFDRFFLRACDHRFDCPAFARDLPVDLPFQRHDLRPLRHAGVTGVGRDLRLGSVQEFCGLGDVRPRWPR